MNKVKNFFFKLINFIKSFLTPLTLYKPQFFALISILHRICTIILIICLILKAFLFSNGMHWPYFDTYFLILFLLCLSFHVLYTWNTNYALTFILLVFVVASFFLPPLFVFLCYLLLKIEIFSNFFSDED